MSGWRAIRWLVVLGLVAMLASALAAVAPARDGATASTVYSLRPDPRMCPSPACGGFWASRINRSSTTCLDGDVRPACYLAAIDPSALPARRRGRARVALEAPRTLVDGSFVPYANAAFPQLAALAALDVWVAHGADGWTGNVYRVTDTGIVCIRAPCFSLRATVVNTTRSVKLSEIDLEAAGAPAIVIGRARALLSHGSVLVTGTVQRVPVPGAPDSGRALVASQLWLPA